MDKYISLTNIVGRVSEINPSNAIQSWLRDYASLEFLMLWENKYNPDFDKSAYDDLIQKIRDNQITTLTMKQWIESTKAIGITSKQGRNGGTYAQQAIACEFMMWLSPRYRFMMIETFLLTDKGGRISMSKEPELFVIPADEKPQEVEWSERQISVAAYCRVSTDDEEQLASFEVQKDYYTAKIMENRQWTMAGIFADKGISVTSAKKRPNFKRCSANVSKEE